MAQITWKNINAPSFAEASALYQSAGQQIGNAFQGLSGALETFKNERVDQDNRAYLTGALQAQNPDQLAEYLTGQGAALAGRGNVSTDAMLQASGLADTLSSRRAKDLEYSEAQKAIDTRGDLGNYLMATLSGQAVDPAVAAQAMTNPLFAQAAPSVLMGRMGYDQKDSHFNKSLALQQQQMAQSAAQHKERMATQGQASASKVNEALAKQIVGGILSNPNIDPVTQMSQIQEVIKANPTMAAELTFQAQKMRSDQIKLNDQFGLTAAAEVEQAKADKPINVGQALMDPVPIMKMLKDIPGFDNVGMKDLFSSLNYLVEKGKLNPEDSLSKHELTRLAKGGVDQPMFFQPSNSIYRAFRDAADATSFTPFGYVASKALEYGYHPSNKWEDVLLNSLIK